MLDTSAASEPAGPVSIRLVEFQEFEGELFVPDLARGIVVAHAAAAAEKSHRATGFRREVVNDDATRSDPPRRLMERRGRSASTTHCDSFRVRHPQCCRSTETPCGAGSRTTGARDDSRRIFRASTGVAGGALSPRPSKPKVVARRPRGGRPDFRVRCRVLDLNRRPSPHAMETASRASWRSNFQEQGRCSKSTRKVDGSKRFQ